VGLNCGRMVSRFFSRLDGPEAEEVANLDSRNWEYRINIIDKNWDGVGGWVA
jgi:hypothetical protein